MNPREKILATCLVGVLVVAGLGMVIHWAVVQRWQHLEEDLRGAVKEEAELRDRLANARTAEDDWEAFTPLSHNVDRAEQIFRQDISELLERHGLGVGVTIRALPPRRLKSGFTEVRLSVQAQGTLNQLVGFQCDFYRRTYLARLEQVNIMAEGQRRRGRWMAANRGARGDRGSSRGGASDVGEVQLNLTMTVTALVLPEEQKLGLEQGVAITMEREDQGRLPRPREGYDEIAVRNIFRPWKPPPMIEQREESAEVRVVDRKPEPSRLEPSRPDKVLVGVTSTDRKLAAYVRDEERLELPPEKLRINDEVDDGTLVLVHPRGMVVQVERQRGSAFDYTYYLYKLGTRFSERVELDPEAYPEIQERLEEALVP